MEGVSLAGGQYWGVVWADSNGINFVREEAIFIRDGHRNEPTVPKDSIVSGKVAEMFERWVKERVDEVADLEYWTVEEVSLLPPSLPSPLALSLLRPLPADITSLRQNTTSLLHSVLLAVINHGSPPRLPALSCALLLSRSLPLSHVLSLLVAVRELDRGSRMRQGDFPRMRSPSRARSYPHDSFFRGSGPGGDRRERDLGRDRDLHRAGSSRAPTPRRTSAAG